MVIPFDDHIVHRGHGIFDTAAIVDGKIYDLEAHLDRFLLSADAIEAAPSRLARRDARHHRADRPRRAAAATARFATGCRRGPGSLELTPARGRRARASS